MIVPNVTDILKRLLAATMLLAGLSACDDKNEPAKPSGPELPDGHTYLSVLIKTDAPSGRAASDPEGTSWGNPYNHGWPTEFENKILEDKIHIALFKNDGTPIANYYSGDDDTDAFIQPIPGTYNMFYVYFDITDVDLKKGLEYICAVNANYSQRAIPSGSAANTYFDFETLVNTAAGGGTAGPDYYKGRIPMFGVVKWTMGQYDAAIGYYDISTIGTVHMLRSVCKIEVLLPNEDESAIAPFLEFNNEIKPHLALVSGRHLNKSGYVAPMREQWMQSGIFQTTDLSFTNSYNERIDRWASGAANNPDLYLPATIEDENGKVIGYYIYLPEASGRSMLPFDDALRLNVSVKFSPEGNKELTRTITGTLFPSIYYDEENQRYPDYVNYNRWKLYRNHIYRFVITGVANETSLIYDVSQTGSQTIDVPTFE